MIEKVLADGTTMYDFSLEQEASKKENGFPVSALGALSPIVAEYQSIYSTPIDFWGCAFLSSISSVLGNKVALRGKYRNAPLLWFAFVAPTGSGKTQPISIAYEPIVEQDNKCYAQWESEHEAWEKCRENSKRDGVQFDAPEPVLMQRIINDASPEAVFHVHRGNPEGITIVSDELLTLIKNKNRYNSNGFTEQLLGVWSGSPLTINRKSEKPMRINDPHISIIGGLQPGVFSELARDGNDTNGFLQRFCYVFPEPAMRPPYNSRKVSIELENRWRSLLIRLDEMQPKELTLSREAEKVFAAYYDRLSRDIYTAATEFRKGMLAKLDIIALRISILLHCVEEGDSLTVSGKTMENAVRLCGYFEGTAAKVETLLFRDKSRTIGKEEAIVALNEEYGIKNMTAFAESIGVSRPYVSKVLKKA